MINESLSSVHKIIFFDGLCNLCNFWIDRVVAWDKQNIFRVASLQGETAQQLLATSELKPLLENLATIVYWHDGRVLTESTAILQIYGEARNLMWLVRFFFILPKFIRDGIYRLVARNRYRIFGKRETCRLPTPEERSKFLP